MKKILVTGGLGYIGSHTVVELQSAGYDVVIIDNLENSSQEVKNRITNISGHPIELVVGTKGASFVLSFVSFCCFFFTSL